MSHEGGSRMSDQRTERFAAHVHEVIDLDAHGASMATIESHVDAMSVDGEEQSALWLLAFSLHNGAQAPHTAPRPRVPVGG